MTTTTTIDRYSIAGFDSAGMRTLVEIRSSDPGFHELVGLLVKLGFDTQPQERPASEARVEDERLTSQFERGVGESGVAATMPTGGQRPAEQRDVVKVRNESDTVRSGDNED